MLKFTQAVAVNEQQNSGNSNPSKGRPTDDGSSLFNSEDYRVELQYDEVTLRELEAIEEQIKRTA